MLAIILYFRYFKTILGHNYKLKFYQKKFPRKFWPKRFHKIEPSSAEWTKDVFGADPLEYFSKWACIILIVIVLQVSIREKRSRLSEELRHLVFF
jgi:hypothetical protein